MTGQGYEGLAERADQLIDLGRDAQAMELIARMQRDFPEHEGPTRLLEARAHSRADRDEESARAAARAVELMPEEAIAHLLLGQALHGTGNSQAAEKSLRTAIELDPQSAQGRAILAILLAELGRAAEGAEIGADAVRLAPEEHTSHFAYGYCLTESDPKTAERAFLETLRCDPTFGPALLQLTVLRIQRGDDVGAARGIADAAALDPHDTTVHLLIDMLLTRVLGAVNVTVFLGLLVVLPLALLAVKVGLPAQIPAAVVALIAVASARRTYRRARPLYDALPGSGMSLARSLLRKRRLVLTVIVLLCCQWLALVVSIGSGVAGWAGPLLVTCLAGFVVCPACGILAKRAFRRDLARTSA